MSETKCLITKTVIKWDDCLTCAAKRARPECPYPYAVLKTLAPKGDRDKEIHVSDLVQCPRKSYYHKTVEQSPRYPHEMGAAGIGTIIHAGLEHSDDPHLLNEIDLFTVFEGVPVTGRCDGYMPHIQHLVDYKTKQYLSPEKVPSEEHILQIKTYALMLERAGKPVKTASIVYIDTRGGSDCQKCKTKLLPHEPGWLTCPTCSQTYSTQRYHLGVVTVDVDLTEQGEHAEWVVERATALDNAIDTKHAPPGEPGWLCAYCPFAARCPDAAW